MRSPFKTFTILGIGLIGMSQFVMADEFTDKYGTITEHNIFLKDRPRPHPPASRNSDRTNRPQVEESPESRIVLRGVVIEDNELRAYFENTRGSSMQKVVPGDAIGKGHVVEIAIDAVQYEQDGKTEWIEMGHNLAGTKVTSATTSYNRPQLPNAAPKPAITGERMPAGSMPMSVPTMSVPMNADGEPVEEGAPGETQQPTTPAVDPSTLSMEERMKLRRAQEKTPVAKP